MTGDTILKKKISDTLQAVACRIPLIDLLEHFRLLRFNKNAVWFLHKAVWNITYDHTSLNNCLMNKITIKLKDPHISSIRNCL